jgi:hypothetical protein
MAGGDDDPLLRLLFGRIGNEKSPGSFGLFFDSLDDYAVMQRSDVHFFLLSLIVYWDIRAFNPRKCQFWHSKYWSAKTGQI